MRRISRRLLWRAGPVHLLPPRQRAQPQGRTQASLIVTVRIIDPWPQGTSSGNLLARASTRDFGARDPDAAARPYVATDPPGGGTKIRELNAPTLLSWPSCQPRWGTLGALGVLMEPDLTCLTQSSCFLRGSEMTQKLSKMPWSFGIACGYCQRE